MTIVLTVTGNPVPWAAHKGFGKRAYSPRYHEKIEAQWQLRNQWKTEAITHAVSIEFMFSMPIPLSTSRKLRAAMIAGEARHMRKPDATNLQKFMEDAMKGIVIVDDNQVVKICSSKKYSTIPMTEIRIEVLE